jgi:hypothetical protein
MSRHESKMRTMREVRNEDFMELVERFTERLCEIVMHMVALNILS